MDVKKYLKKLKVFFKNSYKVTSKNNIDKIIIQSYILSKIKLIKNLLIK